jgi:peptidoglycan/LPS O-acetylase OafA/YrhL
VVPERERVYRPELDGLRGVAVLVVVFAHVVQGVSPHDRGLAPWLHSMGGRAGVQLFFVLSGYLITGVLLRGGGLRRFYWRRWRRLYPTLLVVTAVAFAWSGDAGSAIRALTYTENIPAFSGSGWGDEHPMGHTWSLAVEEQFYLVWPVLLLAARRYAAVVAAVGILGAWWVQVTVDWSPLAEYVGLRWDAVLAGCLIALTDIRGTRPLLWVGMTVLALYTLGEASWAPAGTDAALTIACALVVASVHHSRWLRARWIGHVGRLSYSLYLWHVLVMRLDVPVAVSLTVSVVLAEATYLLVDRWAQGRSGRLTEHEPVEADIVGERVASVTADPADDHASQGAERQAGDDGRHLEDVGGRGGGDGRVDLGAGVVDGFPIDELAVGPDRPAHVP